MDHTAYCDPVTSTEVAVTNLLYRYAEMVDAGQFEELRDLFAHARCIVLPPPAEPVDGATMADLMASTTIRYDDGTPHTRHVITNPILTVDEEGGVASCRSYYTVFQQTPSLPLQAVVAGRYHDGFARIDGEWHFTLRDYTMIDMVGDTSQHLRIEPPR